MYKLKHPEHGETTVSTELAMTRHLEAGWELMSPEEKEEEKQEVEVLEEPKRRGRKPKDDNGQ